MKKTADFLIIGAGIVGVNIARNIKLKYPGSSVVVIDKEFEPGLHASGRNSGVLHAGFYYPSDSMKARFCRDGNKFLTDYCLEKEIPINKCGKIVIATEENQQEGLQVLIDRARANDIDVFVIDEKDANEIEPRAKVFGKALYSPTTSTVSPNVVIKSMVDDIIRLGVQMVFGAKFLGHNGARVETTRGVIEAGYVINSAGLYADKIAQNYGFSKNYRILPFKGLYLYASQDFKSLRTNIYPVPDLNYPFLGVHFTVDDCGNTKIGPTAVPALWREHYGGLQNFNAGELVEILGREVSLFSKNSFGFRNIAIEELKKQSRKRMAELASSLVTGVKTEYFTKWGKPGIRAQLVDVSTNELEMDFVCEGDNKSFHILNAVSPAFTCSIPFSEYVVNQVFYKIS